VGRQRRGVSDSEGATRRREGMGSGPDRWAVPGLSAVRPRCAQAGGAVRTGARHPLMCGPWLAVGGRGEERRWAHGPDPEKNRSGPSSDEHEGF
jgi:hypothetical protein